MNDSRALCSSSTSSHADGSGPTPPTAAELSKKITPVIDSLKEQVITERCSYIKDKVEVNKKKLESITNHVFILSKSRRTTTNGAGIARDMLTHEKGQLYTMSGFEMQNGDRDSNCCLEESSNASISTALGINFGGKNTCRPIKLPEVPKLPPYTTWIFLDRNQRMTEDQSVVGRRRIYYDQNCGEALICSDSEEEIIEEEEEKKEFGNGEDYILRKAIQQLGCIDAVLDSLSSFLGRKPCEIKDRYDTLLKSEENDALVKKGESRADAQIEESLMEKDLDAALDSFDNLFCRRCLVFDCRLHGCSQDLVFPVEKHAPWSNFDEGVACSKHCYRLVVKSESVATVSSVRCLASEEPAHSSGPDGVQTTSGKRITSSIVGRTKSHQSESASSNAKASESSESEVSPHKDSVLPQRCSSPSKIKSESRSGSHKRNSKRVAERVLVNIRKRQKRYAVSDSDSVVSGGLRQRDSKLGLDSRKLNKEASSSKCRTPKTSKNRKTRKKESQIVKPPISDFVQVDNANSHETFRDQQDVDGDECSRKEEFVDENTCKHEISGDAPWKVLEKSLFAKGMEIFGKNSCLIARNLLDGMKTCNEVFQYMNYIENKAAFRNGDGTNCLGDDSNKADYNSNTGTEYRRRTKFLRRRGRVRRLKYTWKSAGYHSIRKRISEKKDQPCRQYNPCGCQSGCGKQCPCILNGTCCEKYCGCPKICKNRFRGCHCAKSQCRSRQCPCFAANRECDPDVCRNCWVGCGDGTLGGPIQRGDNYECRNMKLLLKQQQRVLLGRSDVSGWGAFLKNSVGKHEYLGEYTGELISHREADKRGKIYDRENSSFLFNLNDQFVLDAYRKGDKLKFANHSPDPNCYAKVIMVAGDHRVGIFAKERINAGEELFYDYRYEPDRAPAWARKPETSSLKKDEAHNSVGRAKKLA